MQKRAVLQKLEIILVCILYCSDNQGASNNQVFITIQKDDDKGSIEHKRQKEYPS